MATLVYRYGIPARTPAGRRPNGRRQTVPVAVPEAVTTQLKLAHQLRQDLVTLELAHEEAMRALWSAHPQIATTEQELAAAETALADLLAQTKPGRISDPTAAAAVKDAKASVRALRATRRVQIGEVYPITKPQIEALRAELKALRKALYANYVQQQGLFWATYNAVLEDHVTAVKLVDRKRVAGQPARLRHRLFFDGTGTITVQLQRQAGDPPRLPALLASGGGKWRNVLQVVPWLPPDEFDKMPRPQRFRTRLGHLRMYVGNSTHIQLPLVVHRMMPPDADVAMAQLTVSRIGHLVRMHLAVTIKIPDVAPVVGRPTVAVHTGWRQRDDGSLRVAVWSSPVALDIPDRLREFVIAYDSGRRGEIVVPAAMVNVASRPDALRSRRDLAMAPMIERLAGWLDAHPLTNPDGEELTGTTVRQWRSPGRFATLAIALREHPPADLDGQAVAAYTEAWRQQDKHLWSWESSERHQTHGRRDDMWRQVAAWLTDRAGLVLFEEVNLANLRRRHPDDPDPALPEPAARLARARANLAAPGRLRQYLVNAAGRRGVAVRDVDAKYLTRTCPTCGVVGDADGRYARSAVVTCPACGCAYDQDHSAAKLMLTREYTPAATT